jgi:NitT/TauT family transport system substrate-binding protein
VHIIRSRRNFLATLSATAAGVLGTRGLLADAPPPETNTIRLRRDPAICVAPWYIAEDLLHAEGFTDVRYVPTQQGIETVQMIARGQIDFVLYETASLVVRVDEGAGHNDRRFASRLLRAVRARTDSDGQRPEG